MDMTQPSESSRPGAAETGRGRVAALATGIVVALLVLAASCAPDDQSYLQARQDSVDRERGGGDVRPPAIETALTAGDTIAGHPSWTEEDWAVLERTVRWAWENRIDRLPVGERIARIGETYVGTDYVPQTLDPPGEERLVINLRALDCVTYVEGMLTLAHFVRRASPEMLEERGPAMDLYEEILTSIRYRDGLIRGYPSRLHYFTEWIWENAEGGYVEVISDDLGVVDPEPISFMTAHRDAYHQLSDPEILREIERVERRLNRRERHYIPEERVKSVEDRIRTGDIIAATSTLEGLDVAHTGIALWKDGVLHLMHAPLVGEDVQISEKPLADRLLGIGSQDGIMVARPLER